MTSEKLPSSRRASWLLSSATAFDLHLGRQGVFPPNRLLRPSKFHRTARCGVTLVSSGLILADAPRKIVGMPGLCWSASGKCSLIINWTGRLGWLYRLLNCFFCPIPVNLTSHFLQCMWLIQYPIQPQSKHVILGNLLQFTWFYFEVNSHSTD